MVFCGHLSDRLAMRLFPESANQTWNLSTSRLSFVLLLLSGFAAIFSALFEVINGQLLSLWGFQPLSDFISLRERQSVPCGHLFEICWRMHILALWVGVQEKKQHSAVIEITLNWWVWDMPKWKLVSFDAFGTVFLWWVCMCVPFSYTLTKGYQQNAPCTVCTCTNTEINNGAQLCSGAALLNPAQGCFWTHGRCKEISK